MDRTSWIGVITCIILFFVWKWYMDSSYPQKNRPLSNSSTSVQSTNSSSSNTTNTNLTAGIPPQKPSVQVIPSSAPEQTVKLENSFIRVTFTSHGGAIKSIELLKHLGKTENENVILHGHSLNKFLERTGWKEGQETYLLEQKDNKVIASTSLPNGLGIERTFEIKNDYQINFQETISNASAQTVVLPNYHLSIGSGEPIHIHEQNTYIKAGWMARNSDSYKPHAIAEMSGGFFSKAVSESTHAAPDLNWASTSNQFFASIVKIPNESKALDLTLNKIEIPDSKTPKSHSYGINSSLSLTGFSVNPQSQLSFQYDIYAGPKDYRQLKNLTDHQYSVMDFSIWGWVIKPLLSIMHFIHNYVPNYGWVIILLTIFLKLVFWPLQSAANASMKKMQALTPKMEEIRKKHEKDPQKMNEEIMKLYRDYGVNPLGGCLPMLVQFPIFLGLYTMLQSAVDVRNHSFLWIKDLAQPDTVFTIQSLGLDINPLPLIMTASSVLLMRMNPQANDNPQMKMFQYMPLIFLFMLYNFAAALSLYWTVNNLLSMVQTYQNLKAPTPKLQKLKAKMPFGFGKK